jgi:hypothetical protein
MPHSASNMYIFSPAPTTTQLPSADTAAVAILVSALPLRAASRVRMGCSSADVASKWPSRPLAKTTSTAEEVS